MESNVMNPVNRISMEPRQDLVHNAYQFTVSAGRQLNTIQAELLTALAECMNEDGEIVDEEGFYRAGEMIRWQDDVALNLARLIQDLDHQCDGFNSTIQRIRKRLISATKLRDRVT